MLQDFRWALCSLPNRPGFVAVVVTTVALAIGANTAMFSIVYGVLLHPLPYPDAERIVRVVERAPDGGKTRISTLTYLDWAEQSTVFEHLAAQATRWRPTLTGREEPLQLSGSRISANYFEILGIAPALGRTFASGEDRPGNDRVVVLSHALWQSRFGSDPAILGRSVMLAGRPLSEADSARAPPVMLINETLAKRTFPGETAIGQRMLVQQIVPGRTELGDEIAWEIVGIIADERIDGLADNESGGMYVSNRQSPVYDVSLLIGASVEPQNLIAPVRAAIDTVDRDQAMSQIRTLEQIVSESVGSQRFQTLLLGAFAGIALLLATVGVHGVVAHSVAQRVHEMGIRAALGANARHLRGLVLGDGMHMILIGLTLGLIGAVGAMRVMRSMLFGVTAYDPVTLLAAAAALVTAAGAACFVQARRVARADPNVALRWDG